MSNNNKRRELVNLWEMSKVETIEEFYNRKFDWVPLPPQAGTIFKLTNPPTASNPSKKGSRFVPYSPLGLYKTIQKHANR